MLAVPNRAQRMEKFTRFPDGTRSEAAEMGRARHGVTDGAGDARHSVALI
jgi:hypothetical protein